MCWWKIVMCDGRSLGAVWGCCSYGRYGSVDMVGTVSYVTALGMSAFNSLAV